MTTTGHAARAVCGLMLAASLTLGGCGVLGSLTGGGDNAPEPAELTAIAPGGPPVETLWQIDASSGQGDNYIRLNPALSAGRLFVCGHEGDVSAFDAASGQRLWRADTGLAISAGVGLGDGLVLAGSKDGDVVALRQQDGDELWRTRVSSEVLAAPVGAGGVIVVRANDGSLNALSAAEGAPLWRYTYSVPPLTLRGASAPLLIGGSVIAGLSTGRLLLLDLETGRTVGERTVTALRGRTELDRIHDIDAEMAFADGVVYVGSYQGNLSAIDLRSGQTLWNRPFSSHTGMGIDARQVYANDTDDVVWAFDRTDGTPRWQQDALRHRRLSAPAANGGYVAVGDYQGYLHWLDASDGVIRARVRLGDAVAAAPLAAAGVLYVLDASGGLHALRARTMTSDS